VAAARRRALRRPPDAAAVEERERRDVAAEETVEPAEAEGTASLDEEGPPLREEGLERRQVDDRRIHFDLAEVGVDGRVEREVGRQQVLEIGTGPRIGVLLPVEGIVGVSRLQPAI